MKLALITFLSIIFCTCQVPKSEISSNIIPSADSIALLNEIVQSMKVDIFENTFIITNIDTTYIVRENVCFTPRPHFIINTNDRNQWMIKNEIDAPLIPRLIEYFTKNKQQNDLNNDAPMYVRFDEKEIMDQINREKSELKEAMENKRSKNEIALIEKNLLEWEQRLKALNTLGIKQLPLIKSTLVSIKGTRNSKVDSNNVLDSVLVGFYFLRDLVAREYFNESYLSIYKKYKLYRLPHSYNQLEALKILYPLLVVDETKLKKYKNIQTVENIDLGLPKINVIFENE